MNGFQLDGDRDKNKIRRQNRPNEEVKTQSKKLNQERILEGVASKTNFPNAFLWPLVDSTLGFDSRFVS